jgi:F0F1-type ATP synthase membrane subunit a
MKIKTVFFVCFLTLLNLSSIIAAPVTPPPAPMSANAVNAPVNPPTSDINQNIVLLLVCALIFGMHTIYKYNLKRKASI